MTHTASIHAAGASDIGRLRTNNEDSILVDDGLKLYIVADGIGRHQSGEIASRLVVDIMRDYFRQSPQSDRSAMLVDDDTLTPEANQLVSSIVLWRTAASMICLNSRKSIIRWGQLSRLWF